MSGQPLGPLSRPPMTFMGASPWRLFYSNIDGEVVELPFGTTGQQLVSAGPSAPPVWQSFPNIIPFVGATLIANGVMGLVPAPLVADRLKFLRGDGYWATIPAIPPGIVLGGESLGTAGEAVYLGESGTNLLRFATIRSADAAILVTYNLTLKSIDIAFDSSQLDDLVGATQASNGVAGIVPQPLATQQNRVLMGDGTWAAGFGRYVFFANSPGAQLLTTTSATKVVLTPSLDLLGQFDDTMDQYNIVAQYAGGYWMDVELSVRATSICDITLQIRKNGAPLRSVVVRLGTTGAAGIASQQIRLTDLPALVTADQIEIDVIASVANVATVELAQVLFVKVS